MKMVSGVGKIAHLEKFRRHGIVYAFCGWHIFSHDMQSGRASEAKALCKKCQKLSEKAFNDSYALSYPATGNAPHGAGGKI